jgi:hypothetical protein
MPSNIKFEFTPEQQTAVAEYLGKSLSNLEDYQICELLDEFIDEVCFG